MPVRSGPVGDPNRELLGLARSIAVEAAELAAKRRAEGVTVAASKSSAEDIVTFADREVEAFIRSSLLAARPNDGFLGEESTESASAGTSGLTWVVDPIDGTVNYLYGIPAYNVSIAVVEGEADPETWHALAGCVVNPAIGEVFTATDARGAFLGDTALHVNPASDLSQALVATGFAYSAEVRARQGLVLSKLLPQVRDIRRIGAAALDLCYVAAGRYDAYFERGLKPWDHAAGALIAREAGAHVGGFDGSPVTADFGLAAEPVLAARLEAIVADLFREAGL
ncbi:inositol monophosphatase family protein [Subtercola boreus]|uniref:Inositol-1-monophosphatase n=1 Tax=Subtercola boreus TaxID=120213 RepID=A0A3E0W7Y1_9MICO|nr:inositol monophosphatase family protein [Subtercola boreus]RFA18793.1 inositol monophosphatase [Subtercola boreus]RFA18908.1 inositol monophosphatase [Subtercola boreus]RFA25445.1 inositol monophosphatase [Subtercola boreus]